MKNVFVVIVIFLLMFILFNFEHGKEKVYDCGMAEWHPDIPVQVKEECRRLQYEYYKQNQPQEKRLET
jgi:hypothetical protein